MWEEAHTLEFWQDQFDNQRTTGSGIYTLGAEEAQSDSTGPTITFENPTPNNETQLINFAGINATVTDETAVDTVTLEWNGTNETMPSIGGDLFFVNKTDQLEANYTFRVFANDSSNNNATSETRWVVLGTRPVVTINSPGNATVGTTFTLNVSATDEFDDNMTCRRSLDAGSIVLLGTILNASSVTESIATTNGAHNITAYCEDDFGNSTADVFFTVSGPPVITFQGGTPAGNTTIGASHIDVNVSTDIGLDTVNLQWVGVNESMTKIRELEYFKNKSIAVSGNYSFQVFGNSSGGNESSTELRFVGVDLAAPTITIFTPENTTYGNSTQDLAFNVTDDFETVLLCRRQLNGGSVTSLGNVDNGTLTNVSISSIPAGNNNLSVYCEDRIRNATATVNFTVTNNAPTITLNLPANTTVIARAVTYNFSVTDENTDSMTCSRDIDGAQTALGEKANASSTEENATFNEGFHNFRIRCRDGFGLNATEEVNLTTLLHNITIETFFSQRNETDQANFSVVVNVADNVETFGSNATLSFNNTLVNATVKTFNGTALNFTVLAEDVPLVASNSTSLDFSWNYTVVLSNDTTNRSGSTTIRTVDVLHAYFVENITAPSSATENSIVDVTTAATQVFDRATIEVNVTFDDRLHTTTANVSEAQREWWTAFAAAPNLTTNDTVISMNATVFITFQDFAREVMTATINLTVSQLGLVSCGGISNTTALNFTLVDEEALSNQVIGTTDITVETWEDPDVQITNSSFRFSNASSFELCIFPTDGQFTTNATLRYEDDADLYSVRFHFMTNFIVNGTKKERNLILLNDTLSDIVLVTVLDSNNDEVQDVILSAQRQYVDENIFRTVAMGRTDEQGRTPINLRVNDVTHKFLVEQNGDLLRTTFPGVINKDPNEGQAELTIILSPSTIGEFSKYRDSVTTTCSFDNSTKDLACTVLDSSGLMKSSNFTVWRLRNLDEVVECDASSSDFSVSYNCTLGDVTNNTYRYVVAGVFNETSTVLEQDVLNFRELQVFGVAGVFLALLLFITLAFVGLFSPQASMVMGMGGLIFAAWLDLVIVGPAALAGMAIAVGIYMIRARR